MYAQCDDHDDYTERKFKITRLTEREKERDERLPAASTPPRWKQPAVDRLPRAGDEHKLQLNGYHML